jgi:hypothetical protein
MSTLRSKHEQLDYLQLPPQIKTTVSDLVRSISRQSFEKKASQAVIDASGTVAASRSEMFLGTRKQILSWAFVYSLNAPRPLTSPNHFISAVACRHGDVQLTTPKKAGNRIAFCYLGNFFTKTLDFACEVTTKHSAVAKEV